MSNASNTVWYYYAGKTTAIKTLSPMLLTLFGIVTLVRLLQPVKA
jgi:hypothetical protein